jgi:cytochrome P450
VSTAEHFAAWHTSTEGNGLILLRTPFHNNRLLLSNPKALAEVLVHNAYDFEKPKAIRNFLRRILGDGLVVVEGDEHRFQRRHIQPAFSFRHIRDLYAVMWLKSVAMVEQINHEVLETETIEMYEWSSKATLDIIGIAALGREFNVIKNTEDELVQCYKQILEPSIEKLIYFLVTVLGPTKLIQMLPWKLNHEFKHATDSLRTICRRLVQDKRDLIKADADHHFDILSLLIKSSNFADDEMVDQMLTFLAAGLAY